MPMDPAVFTSLLGDKWLTFSYGFRDWTHAMLTNTGLSCFSRPVLVLIHANDNQALGSTCLDNCLSRDSLVEPFFSWGLPRQKQILGNKCLLCSLWRGLFLKFFLFCFVLSFCEFLSSIFTWIFYPNKSETTEPKKDKLWKSLKICILACECSIFHLETDEPYSPLKWLAFSVSCSTHSQLLVQRGLLGLQVFSFIFPLLYPSLLLFIVSIKACNSIHVLNINL